MRFGDFIRDLQNPNGDNRRAAAGAAIAVTILSAAVLLTKCAGEESDIARDSGVIFGQAPQSTVDEAPDF